MKPRPRLRCRAASVLEFSGEQHACEAMLRVHLQPIAEGDPVELRDRESCYKKILVANRGGIAVRITLACIDYGTRSIAVNNLDSVQSAKKSKVMPSKVDWEGKIEMKPSTGGSRRSQVGRTIVDRRARALDAGYCEIPAIESWSTEKRGRAGE